MTKGLIATIISILSLLVSVLLGRKVERDRETLRNQVAKSESETKAKDIEIASARMTSEAISSLMEAEAERHMTDAEITRKLASASSDEDVIRLAQVMAERATARIKNRK